MPLSSIISALVQAKESTDNLVEEFTIQETGFEEVNILKQSSQVLAFLNVLLNEIISNRCSCILNSI